ncbi:hypothetical protein ACFQ1I_15820 [Kitasatospora arboriphila]
MNTTAGGEPSAHSRPQAKAPGWPVPGRRRTPRSTPPAKDDVTTTSSNSPCS